MIGAVIKLTELISGRRVPQEHRKDVDNILECLRNSLHVKARFWILVIDSADNDDVLSLVGKLCNIMTEQETSDSTKLPRQGWVIVTSRQRASSIGKDFVNQEIELQPLSAMASMEVLLRHKLGLTQSRGSNSFVKVLLFQMEMDDEKASEFSAMNDLSENSRCFSIGGLPLGLAQVGSYLRRNRISFSTFVEMYRNAIGKKER